MNAHKETETLKESLQCQFSRRKFLLYSSTAIATTTVMLKIPGSLQAQEARITTYPRKNIAQLSALRQDQPLAFQYPDEGASSDNLLIKLGKNAGGGIGPDSDVIAFNTYCTHQGGPLGETYNKTHKTFGQCPFHLSIYDLKRHGIVVAGQGYQNLPQILLELEGDEIYAVGVMGLIFGRNDNLIG